MGVRCSLLVKVRGGWCGTLILQSVLAVLGKASSVANVERLDLKIVDPEQSLVRKRKNREDTEQSEESDDESRTIEAKLIMKLVCKHGTSKTGKVSWRSPCRRDQEALVASRVVSVSPGRGRSRLDAVFLLSLCQIASGYH
jgi:cell cycle checkpoint control protein RAD9A